MDRMRSFKTIFIYDEIEVIEPGANHLCVLMKIYTACLIYTL